jgi:hypothetical protein
MKANEKKETNGISKKESSTLLPEKSLEDITLEMTKYVIEHEVYMYPYIAWLSKGQLLWGKGTHWKESSSYLGKGLLRHAGIRKPSQADLDFQTSRFGYCMEWPEPRTWGLTGLVKSEFINKKATGKGFNNLEFLYGRGYIDEETGKLDPRYSYGITGWFIMHVDSAYRQEQIEWLENQPEYIRTQYARCCSTFKDVIQQQIESGNKKAITNHYLLDQEVYKEIRDALKDRKKLPELIE